MDLLSLEGFFFLAFSRPIETAGDIASKGSFVVLEFEKPLKTKNQGF